AHREEAGLPDSLPRDGAKSSTPIVDPDAIGRLKIIADVEVGCAVVIQIAEHCRQSPVIRRADGLAVLVEEGPIGPAHWHETAVADITEEDVRLAVLEYTAAVVETEPADQIRRRSRPAV